LIRLGRRLGLRVRALLTDMDQPLGDAVGNALEVREAIDVLRGGGPADTRALTIRLGAEMLVLGRVARDLGAGARAIAARLDDGAALERFRAGVRLQGGDLRAIDEPDRLPRARHTRVLAAPRGGWIARADAGALGRAATLLGAGRLRKEDEVAPGAGLLLHAKVGARVERGQPLCTVAFDDPSRERSARPLIAGAFRIAARRVPARPLVLERLGA
jgi:thymidine phosphorylase